MTLRMALWGVLGLIVLFALGAGGWILSLPAAPAASAAPAIPPGEAQAVLDALKPPKRERPVVAILGINDATETTDYLMPYGILRRADVAEVVALATGPGPVALFPALKVEPDATTAEFDARYPDGADYLIVPAMSRDDDPAALDFIRAQAAKGAIVIGVCAGAKVVGAAGLLDERKGTTHWYYLKQLRGLSPTMDYVPDRRLVVDGRVVTTTGITASMPMSLTLIEAIAGRDKAEATARELGVENWDARHDSSAFTFTRPFALTAIGNSATFWGRETFGIPLQAGIDEVALALVADAWSRTYRSRALTFAATPEAVVTRAGLRILPDRVQAEWPAATRLPAITAPPAQALTATLDAISGRYGARTSDFVAMQLEYPKTAAR